MQVYRPLLPALDFDACALGYIKLHVLRLETALCILNLEDFRCAQPSLQSGPLTALAFLRVWGRTAGSFAELA